MTGPATRLLVVSGVVVLVTVGLSRGVWVSNLHNALLATAFTLVGVLVLARRPAHRVGLLFLATGLVEAALFAGRQVGHAPGGSSLDRWWAWVGVWPVAVALGLVTLSVLCFPDGTLPSTRWRPVAGAVVVVTGVLAAVSAWWPVEYSAAGVLTTHPVHLSSPDLVSSAWGAVAHPAYAALQVLWVVAIVARWRSSDVQVRRQLTSLLLAAAVSVLALVAGLLVTGSPTPGLLAVSLVPLAAGWAVVRGRHLAAYAALTWLSRAGAEPRDLPTGHARALAEALGASGATVWVGVDDLRAVGVWPEPGSPVAASTRAALRAAPGVEVREVNGRTTGHVSGQAVALGAVSVDLAPGQRLSPSEHRLLDDLAAQAALVLEHLTLADLVAQQQRAGGLAGLSPREQEVLELMARGFSNAAICAELHLSIKTVEPVVSAIFTKLELHADAANNRRVLAVLAYLRE